MANCDVCIGSDDCDGYAEFCNVSMVKARKSHICEECNAEIPVGATYEYVAGKYDGEFFTIKTCECCAEIRSVFSCGMSVAYGMLWEEFLQAEVFQRLTTASPCFQQLSVKSKEFILNRWRKWKFRNLGRG